MHIDVANELFLNLVQLTLFETPIFWLLLVSENKGLECTNA